MSEQYRAQAISEALEWVNAAVGGDPVDPRCWPVLDPLMPHALVVAQRADEVGIIEPTALLFHQLGALLYSKARYSEAEPLMRRVVEMNEMHRGSDDIALAASIGSWQFCSWKLIALTRQSHSYGLH
jgi:hypothetical protein